MLLINAVDVASYTCAPVSRADAALVLGSSVTSGEPSPIFKARLDIAAELFHKHTVSAVIVSGGAFSEGELSEAEGGERYLRTLGVPPDRIFQEPQARRLDKISYWDLTTCLGGGYGRGSWSVIDTTSGERSLLPGN